MKSNKQQRANLPLRRHSPRDPENEDDQPLLSGQQATPSRATMEEASMKIRPSRRSDNFSAHTVGLREEERIGMEEIKLKTAEALAQKQAQDASASGTPELIVTSSRSSE